MKKKFILILCLLFQIPGYVYALDLNDVCYTTNNPYYNSGYGGQCTAFAWGRACENNSVYLQFKTQSYPSAKFWYEYGPVDSLNLTTGSSVQEMSIAVWGGDSSNPYGHVAYVEKVDGNIVYFNEANVDTYNGTNWGGGYDDPGEGNESKSMTIASFESRGSGIGQILGYIYLNGCVASFGKSASTPSKISDFWAGFGIKNNCSGAKTIQDVAISFHDAKTEDMLQKCYRKGSEYVLSAGQSVLTGKVSCNQHPTIKPGNYLLKYKVKYDGTWKEVGEKPVTIIAGKDGVLSFVPAILAGIRHEPPLCPIEKIVGKWDYLDKDWGGIPPGYIVMHTYDIQSNYQGVAFATEASDNNEGWPTCYNYDDHIYSLCDKYQTLTVSLRPGTAEMVTLRNVHFTTTNGIIPNISDRQYKETWILNYPDCNSAYVEKKNRLMRSKAQGSSTWSDWGPSYFFTDRSLLQKKE